MIDRSDIGHRVQDAHGTVGILRDIDPAWEDPSDPPYDRVRRPVAFIAPERGGREWHADPTTVTRAWGPDRSDVAGPHLGAAALPPDRPLLGQVHALQPGPAQELRHIPGRERPPQVHVHPERVRGDLPPALRRHGMNHDLCLIRHAPSVRRSRRQGIRNGAGFRVLTSSGAAPQVPRRAAERDVLSGLLRKRVFGEETRGQTRTCRRPPVGGGLPERVPPPWRLFPPASWGRPARTTGCRPDPYGTRPPRTPGLLPGRGTAAGDRGAVR